MKIIDFQLCFRFALEPPSKVMGGHSWRNFLYLQYLAGKLIFFAHAVARISARHAITNFVWDPPARILTVIAMKILMGSANPFMGYVHLKMLSRSSVKHFFKS